MGIYCTVVRRQISCHDDYAGTSHIPLSLSGFLPSQNTTYTTKPTLERSLLFAFSHALAYPFTSDIEGDLVYNFTCTALQHRISPTTK